MKNPKRWQLIQSTSLSSDELEKVISEELGHSPMNFKVIWKDKIFAGMICDEGEYVVNMRTKEITNK